MSTSEDNRKEQSALEEKQASERTRLAEQHNTEEEDALNQQKDDVEAAHEATVASEKDALQKRNQENELNEKKV